MLEAWNMSTTRHDLSTACSQPVLPLAPSCHGLSEDPPESIRQAVLMGATICARLVELHDDGHEVELSHATIRGRVELTRWYAWTAHVVKAGRHYRRSIRDAAMCPRGA